jgi:hypothetical protein
MHKGRVEYDIKTGFKQMDVKDVAPNTIKLRAPVNATELLKLKCPSAYISTTS